MSHITAEMEEQLRRKAAELHNAGLGYRKIAKALGVQPEKVKYWNQRYSLYGERSFSRYRRKDPERKDVQATASGRTIEPNMVKAIDECRNTLVPMTHIARMHGVNYNRLYYLVASRYPDVLTARRLMMKKRG